jgi:hypothetical protein
MSHDPMGLYGLLQGYLYLFFLTVMGAPGFVLKWSREFLRRGRGGQAGAMLTKFNLILWKPIL